MGFLRQIGTEFKNILRVKFLLIFGILILAVSVAFPVITALTAKDENNMGGGPIMYATSRAMAYSYKDMYYPGGNGGEPITVNGVTIMPDNPYYWNIQNLQQQQTDMDETWFTTPGTLDVALRAIDVQINYYVELASYITTYQDYRVDLTWDMQPLFDKFIFENIDKEDPAVLKEGVQNFMYLGEDEAFNKKYVNITPEERLAALDEAEAKIQTLFDVVKNNDFAQYIGLKIDQENNNIKNFEDQIEILEKDIIEHPDQEEGLSQQIEDLQKQIQLVKENNIPILEYRLAHNIVPMADMWQNTALDDITNNRNQIMYTTKVTEEQFNQDQYLAMQYGTYARYSAAIDAQIAKYNNNIIIAQSCLDAEKPDMKYVSDGARSITVQFLMFSILVALFGILVGGWLMASEFQMGTIRLLMIRPKTRLKILMSKFLAGLLLCLVMYVAGIVLNIVLNGICFGFSDFSFPNYTVAGEVGFFAYYIPKFFACIVTIVFAYSVAYMLSVLVKNIAVAIAVPIVCFVASVIGMTVLAYTTMADWLAWTPIPYLQISDFFRPQSDYMMTPVQTMIQNGVPISLTYGIIMLLALAAVCVGVSMLVFKKKDITH